MKKENKSRFKVAEQLSTKTSSLLIVVSCISVLMLMIYFGVSVTSKGTFSAGNSLYSCPNSNYVLYESQSNTSVHVCCDNNYSTVKSMNANNAEFVDLALLGLICTNSSYPSSGVYDVQNGIGRCKTEVTGVTDSTICQSMGDTIFENNTCYVLNNCAKAPVEAVCNGRVTDDGTCIDDSTSTTTQAATQPTTQPGGGNSSGGGDSNCFYGSLDPEDGNNLTCTVICNLPVQTVGNCETAFPGYKCKELGGVIKCKSCKNNASNAEFSVDDFVCKRTGEAVTYSVSFMPNGGTFTDGSSSVTRSCTTDGSSNSCTITNLPAINPPTGKVLNGWSYTTNVTSGYMNSVPVNSSRHGTKIYAIWADYNSDHDCQYEKPQKGAMSGANVDRITSILTQGDPDYCCSTAALGVSGPAYTGTRYSIYGVSGHYWHASTGETKYCYLPSLVDFTFDGTRYNAHLSIDGKCLDGYELREKGRWCIQQECNCDENCVENERCVISNEGNFVAGETVTLVSCQDYVSGDCQTNPSGNANVTCTVKKGTNTLTIKRCNLTMPGANNCPTYTPPSTNPTSPPATNPTNPTSPPATNPTQSTPTTVTKTCYYCEGTAIKSRSVSVSSQSVTCESLGQGYFTSNNVSQCRRQCYQCDGMDIVDNVYVAKDATCQSKGYLSTNDASQCKKTCWYCDGPDEKSTTIASDESCTSHNLKDSKSELNCSSDKKTCFHCVGTSADPVEIDADDKCSNHTGYVEKESDLVCTKTCWYCDGPDKKSVKIAKDKACSSKGSGYKDNKNDLTCITDTPSESKCCACDGKTKVTKGDTTDGKCPSGQTLCSELVCTNSQTGTGAIVIAWIVGLAAIGYSFYYFRRTNKQ